MGARAPSLRRAAAAAAGFGSALLLAGAGAEAGAGPLDAPPLVTSGYPYALVCPEAGERDVVDRWGLDACNCTSYAAWALRANGYRIGWFIRGSMDAWNWPNVARLRHVPTGSAPRAGAVAVWPKLSPPFGHLAFVTAVHGDGTFDVAEYNLPEAEGGREFAFDRRAHVRAAGATFVYAPRRR